MRRHLRTLFFLASFFLVHAALGAMMGPYAPRFWFSTVLDETTYGSDCYADYSPVLDGECYALVWQADGVPFKGFYSSGTYGLSADGDYNGTLSVDPENCHVLEVWPAAERTWIEPENPGVEGYWTAYCPSASNIVQRQYYVDHADAGHFAVYLFDTRSWIGTLPVVSGCDAKTKTIPVLNAYSVVSGLEDIDMVPGSDNWKIFGDKADFNPYGTAEPDVGDFTDEGQLVPTVADKPSLVIVTFDGNGGEVEESSRTVENGSIFAALPMPKREHYDFVGWFTQAEGGMRVVDGTLVMPSMSVLYAQWNADPCVGAYLKLDLVRDLEIKIDADYEAGDKVTVKVEGLPKGLKLVTTQLKETTGKKAVTNVVYTIEGVPTEAVDFATQTMYARVSVTYADKTKGETLQPLSLDIAPMEVDTLTAGILFEPYGPIDIGSLWPKVADAAVNPKDWSFKGWPSGLKYGKDLKVSGTPTKAGVYPITATHKFKLSDGKTTVSETYSAVLTVWGSEDEQAPRYTDRAFVEMAEKKMDATVKSASGLPTGLKFKNGVVSGTPTKAGVFAVTLTMTDGYKETFLWLVEAGENAGFLSTMDWPVKDAAVTVMQGVIQADWTCTADADAKVTASGLPTGLKLAQDKLTGEWALSGTPTKAGNYVATFKTVRNGVTVTERISVIVTENEWTGTWYAEQYREQDASRLGEVTVSANGTVKFVLTEATTNENAKGVIQSSVKKTTVTVKNLDANGKTATLILPRDKKDPLSEDRTCVINFDRNRIIVDGERLLSLFKKETSDEYCIGYWSEVTTIVAEEVLGVETNAYAYMTVTFDAKKRSFKLQGKLWDGTTVSAAANLMLCDVGPSTSPVLVIDKAKNAVLMTFVCDEQGRVAAAFIENGKGVPIGGGVQPWSEQFLVSELKGRKFNQLTDAKRLAVRVDAESSPRQEEVFLNLPEKSLTTALSAQGLAKFTITDEEGWKWVCELLPVDNGGDLQFRGIATGTRKDPITKANVTQYCPVWAEKGE